MIFLYAFLFFISPVSFSSGDSLSARIHPVWSVNTLENREMGPNLHIQSSPVLYKKFVIQGNARDGIKAFTQKSGRQIWEHKIEGGVSSGVSLYKGNLYFGAGDGFFYSLRAKDGELLWKLFIGSDNTGTPLLHDGVAYFVSSNQKIYALSLKQKGELLWIYSGPTLSNALKIRGQSRPFVFRNFLYAGFSEGSIFALHKKTGNLLWKKNLVTGASIFSDLSSIAKCLLVPVFESGLYCLNFRSGQIIWKSKLKGLTQAIAYKKFIYQGTSNRLQTFKQKNGKKYWSLKISGFPIAPSFYKEFAIYGSLSDDSLHVTNIKNKKKTTSFAFGKGLSAPVTINQKTGEVYFISIEGYLHKTKLSQ